MTLLIVIAQPAYEIENVGVPPHPCGKSLKTGKRVDRILIFTFKPYILVYAICIWPVRFDGDRVETFFRDQPLSDLRANSVKLVGSVRSLTDQNKTRIADCFKQGIKVR